MTPNVGFVSGEVFAAHEPGAGHPESPDRAGAIVEALRIRGLLDEVETIEPEAIELERVEAVHDPRLVAWLAATAGGPLTSLDQDTHVSARSFEAARAASGGLYEAAQRVLDGRWRRAFCAARPPGHHAEAGRAMGFCLINHVAVVAQALRDVHALERVAIVDWDVHHGNGTQAIFEDDPSVLYVSLHQHPLFPGTGAAHERGSGAGEGATRNVPLPPRTDDRAYAAAFEDEVLPALEEFAPEFVLVSAGFDAHRDDPLGSLQLDESSFARMTHQLAELVDGLGHGRLVSVLEGGYDLDALGASCAAHVAALLEGA